MYYTDVDLSCLNIDWFAIDLDGKIGHFASGGSHMLPESVICNREKNEAALEFFETIPRASGNWRLSESLTCWFKKWDSFAKKDVYIDVLSEWAERGLWSFDCMQQRKSDEDVNFLVALPGQSLFLEGLSMPQEIRDYVSGIKIPYKFDQLSPNAILIRDNKYIIYPPS